MSRRGSVLFNTGQWPAPTPSVRVREFGGIIVRPFYRAMRSRSPPPPMDHIHVAGLGEPVSISELPNPPPAVTVIILNRQRARMLDDLLASFHRVNCYPNIDLIVVDHASTDDSASVAEKWAKTLPLTVVRCSRNHSFSFSCNRAAERATGDYLVLLNNDIVLSEDIIGLMVAAAAHYRGMVGCKLLDVYPRKNDVSRSVQHIGIRFRGNLRRRVFGPYDARPTSSDERIATAPSHFLAVTAAVSVCRRDDFLRIGGLCENYIYGFEDVDLGLKLSLGWGRKNICLNNICAFHHGRATRKTMPRRQRKSSLESNFKVMSRRFGYAVRRTMLPALFTDDGSLWGDRACVAFVPDPAREDVWCALETLGRRWKIRRTRSYEMKDLALLIVADPDYRLELGRNRPPLLYRIAWIMSDTRQWLGHDFAVYDLVVAANTRLAASITKQGRTSVVELDPNEPDAGDRLLGLFIEYLSARHRVSIKCSNSDDDDDDWTLATALRLAGHFVRIDRPAQWRCPESIRDDVVILMPGMRVCPQADDKIVVACGDAAPDDAVDIRLPMTEPKTLAAAILDAIAPAHTKRMLGPQDRPLTACEPFDSQIVAAWD
ncbi:MAG TPA: glycosyltransferase [Xanthobacteraceae bacterium]|nr:glycosyltransferase [Xanthobacteraceae bacterium]